ncbi:MAG: orotate phosphoribosyltransferase [Candidatus Aenigmatarchaeota archaeon]
MQKSAVCSICGAVVRMPYTCNFCGAVVCQGCYRPEVGLCARCAAKMRR